MSVRAGPLALGAGMAVGFALVLALSGARPVNTDAAWIDLGEAVVPVETGVHPPAFSLPFTSEDPNTVIVGGPDDWTWTSQTDPAQPPTPHAFCVTFTLTSPSATPVPFRVTTHLGVPPFNFTAPFTAQMYQSHVFVTPFSSWQEAPDFADSGLVYIVPFGGQTISASTPLDLKVCATTLPDPPWRPPGPDTYTVSAPVLQVTADAPCVTLVVQGHTPYFLGFTANFDVKALLDSALAGGQITSTQYNAWLPRVYWWGSSASGVTGDDYLVTFTGYDELHQFVFQFADVSLTACAY
jgi:hypothetical protein